MMKSKNNHDAFLTNEQQHALWHPNFPLSNKYDPHLVFEHNMGPNVLWLTEWLTKDMGLQPGMRVLDMGCGKALSSLFLAHEYGVQVWANDLWIPATENWDRVCAWGMQDRIFPVYAEARALPYAEHFFDAIVSLDSYQYYGSDQLYLGYFHKFVKPGGKIGIVAPGLFQEFNGNVPEHLTRPQQSGGIFWAWDCCIFHTAQWWRDLWSLYDVVSVEQCEAMPDGGHMWLRWEQAYEASGIPMMFPSDAEALTTDNNENITFVKMIGTRHCLDTAPVETGPE
jgi:SAM-dependent methyltransferase